MANAANTTKYTFDTVFGDTADIVSDAALARRRRSLTEAEIETLCDAAKAEGRRAGEVLAQEATAAAAREAAGAIRSALTRLDRDRTLLLEQSAQLAFAIARKLASAAVTALPQVDVEAALREAMHQAIGETRIVLKASPAVAEALAPRVAEIAHEEVFDGRIQVLADSTLKRADCRIEWRGGGAERAETAIESAVEKLIARNFGDGAASAGGAGHGR
jgi:flagellar assembly protein FliH